MNAALWFAGAAPVLGLLAVTATAIRRSHPEHRYVPGLKLIRFARNTAGGNQP